MRCIMTPYSSSNSIRRFPWIWSFEKKLNIFRFSDFRISLDCNIPSLDQRLSPVCRAAWSQPLQPSRTVPHPLFENTAKLRIRLFMKTFPWEGPQRNVFMKRRICNLALFSERECGAVREGCSGCDQAACKPERQALVQTGNVVIERYPKFGKPKNVKFFSKLQINGNLRSNWSWNMES